MKIFASAAICGTAFVAPIAVGATVTFDGLGHGEIVTSQFSGLGLNISAVNPNRSHDLAIIFDSTMTGTADPDLEGPPWAGGNLPSSLVMNNLLIIAQDDTDVVAPFGFIDNPNDEGNRPAGDLIFDFDLPQSEFGFDVVDVEGVLEENGMVSFFLSGGLVGSVPFSDFTSRDASVSFGDNTINRIVPFTAAEVGGVFDRVVIMMGGSGGVDNVNFIPTPGAAGLMAIGGLAMTRRRR